MTQGFLHPIAAAAAGVAGAAIGILIASATSTMAGNTRVAGGESSRRVAIVAVAACVGATSLWVWPGYFGVSGAVFGWALLALLILDVEHFWLPDRLTVPLAVSGLIVGIWFPPSPFDRVIGCLIGFSSLVIIALVYKKITGRVGLGGGDPRLFAAIGAWLGWFVLPFVLLLAALLGLALVGYDRFSGHVITRHSRVPLGALLAAAAWGLWLAGPVLGFQDR